MDPISTQSNTRNLTEKDELEMHRDRIVQQALKRRRSRKPVVQHKQAEYPALAKAAMGSDLSMSPTMMDRAVGIPTAMMSGAGLGAMIGTPAGALVGAGRGNVPEGAGRGMIRGGATGAGGIGGLILGRLLAENAGIPDEYAPWLVGAGGLGGAGLGWLGSGAMMGQPAGRADEEKRSSYPGLAKAAALGHADYAPSVPNRAAQYPGGTRQPQGHEVPGSGQGPMATIMPSQSQSVPVPDSPANSGGGIQTGGPTGPTNPREMPYKAAQYPHLAKVAMGMPGSRMAVTAVGDKLPSHSNARAAPPTIANGGITSYGQDAWGSVTGYMPSAAPQATMADAGIGSATKHDSKQEHGDAGMTITASDLDPVLDGFLRRCQEEGLTPEEISARIMKSAASSPEMNDRWVELYDKLIGPTLIFN